MDKAERAVRAIVDALDHAWIQEDLSALRAILRREYGDMRQETPAIIDVARLAAELMDANHDRQELREALLPFVLHARALMATHHAALQVISKAQSSQLIASAFYEADAVYRETGEET